MVLNVAAAAAAPIVVAGVTGSYLKLAVKKFGKKAAEEKI